MMLSELLKPRAVAPSLKATVKREVMVELVELLEAGHGLDSHGEILDQVMRREAMMSTGIGNGVAIPHGKARATDRMVAACAISAQGVEFDAADGEPTYIFLLLVSPENVKVLANISRLLKEESVRKQLREAGSAAALLAALKSAEAQYLS